MARKKLPYSLKKAKLIIQRARFALENDLFLEATWLVSLAMEARLRALIRMNDDSNPGAGFTFEQCLKRVKFLIQKLQDPILSGYVTVELIDEIRSWKNQRNLVLKAIEASHVSRKRIENLAEEGSGLMERLNFAVKKYKAERKHTIPVAKKLSGMRVPA